MSDIIVLTLLGVFTFYLMLYGDCLANICQWGTP